jgi:hypothetical protein
MRQHQTHQQCLVMPYPNTPSTPAPPQAIQRDDGQKSHRRRTQFVGHEYACVYVRVCVRLGGGGGGSRCKSCARGEQMHTPLPPPRAQQQLLQLQWQGHGHMYTYRNVDKRKETKNDNNNRLFRKHRRYKSEYRRHEPSDLAHVNLVAVVAKPKPFPAYR